MKDSKLDELDGTVWQNVERNGIKIKLRKLDDKPDGKLDGKLDGNVEGDDEGKRMKPRYKLGKKSAEEKSSSPGDTP